MPPTDPPSWTERVEARLAAIERRLTLLRAAIGRPSPEIDELLRAAEKPDAADTD